MILPPQPGRSSPRGYEQFYSYDIKHLLDDASYEAQVQAKNKFGWSEMSELLEFHTSTRKTSGEALCIVFK